MSNLEQVALEIDNGQLDVSWKLSDFTDEILDQLLASFYEFHSLEKVEFVVPEGMSSVMAFAAYVHKAKPEELHVAGELNSLSAIIFIDSIFLVAHCGSLAISLFQHEGELFCSITSPLVSGPCKVHEAVRFLEILQRRGFDILS